MSRTHDELERALMRVLRLKRGRLHILATAIRYAGYEGHVEGRIQPFPDGIPAERTLEVEKMCDAAAIRILNAAARAE